MSEAEIAAFLRAVGDGDIHHVRDLLAADPALANAVGPHPYWGGRPQALHVAIETKRADMVALLLDAGADPNGRNGEYDLWSPLMLAIHRDTPDMQNALIARGARIGLAEALLMKDDAAVDALLAHGLPRLAPNGGSILAFARTPWAIDQLIARGAPVDMQDRWGITPVEAMSRAGADGGMLVRWLLAMGADANARASAQSGQSALHTAAWNGDLDMVQLLVEHGADLHARDSEHNEPPRGWAETSVTVTNNPACMDVTAWLAAQGG